MKLRRRIAFPKAQDRADFQSAITVGSDGFGGIERPFLRRKADTAPCSKAASAK
jgi:hypothetical protein